jgi:hypothetical protein
LLLSLKSFVAERGLWLCKSYSKKREKYWKNRQVFKILKQWVL